MDSYPVPNIRSTPQEWRIVLRCFVRERTVHAVMRTTHIPRCRVLRMLHHLRQRMTEERSALFGGPVEMDETYIGGQRKNKRLHIRRIQGKRGHGTDKLPIVGLFDRASGCVVAVVEPHKLDIRFILMLLRMQVQSGALIYTDGFKMYRSIPRHGYRHQFVDHDGGELVRNEIHTNNIEGFWGILKRRLGCIGGIRRVRLGLFVAELAWRFNHRRLSSEEQSHALARLIFGGRN